MPAPPRSKLEITVISAQDLPPIARNLTTYAVAWLKPNHKLTTLIDNHGHTNPKWNHKISFYVDQNYSKSSTATSLTVEIYNVGWLRDILVGSAEILVNILLEKTSKNRRTFQIQLRRPTGVLQGSVNIDVNLINRSIDNANVSHNRIEKTNEKIRLERSRSERSVKNEGFWLPAEGSDDGGRPKGLSRSKSGCSVSVNSMMRPLPTEVAAELKDGLYSTAGGYVFSGRPEEYGGKRDLNAMVAKWQHKVVDDRRLRYSDHHQRMRNGRRGGGGMFSCFGNVQGREFSFICGGNDEGATRKNIRKPKDRDIY